jgi:predicted translin family RNA/ssDNA-binding protein
LQFKCSGTKAIVKEFQIITVPIVAVLAISAYVEAECLYYSYKDKKLQYYKTIQLQFAIYNSEKGTQTSLC